MSPWSLLWSLLRMYRQMACRPWLSLPSSAHSLQTQRMLNHGMGGMAEAWRSSPCSQAHNAKKPKLTPPKEEWLEKGR